MRWLPLIATVLAVARGEFVVELTDANFDELVLKGSESWLLEFYAPWCKHCQNLAPIFEEVAESLQGKLSLGKLDCTVHKETQTRYNVKSYPTLKFYRDGEIRPYRSGRSKEDMIQFGNDMVGPAVAGIDASIDELLAKHSVLVLFLGSLTAPAYAVFSNTAYRLQGVVHFAAPLDTADDTQLKELLGSVGLDDIAADNGIIVQLSAGDDWNVFEGKLDSDNLRDWVMAHSLPLMSLLGPSNFDDVTTTGKLTVFGVVDIDNDEHHVVSDALLVVAKDFKADFVFTKVDGIKFTHFVTQFGFSPNKLPGFFVLNFPDDLYYVDPDYSHLELRDKDDTRLPQQEIQDSLTDFLLAIRSGENKPIHTIPWYNPRRYFKKLEKYASQYSDTQIMIFVVGSMVLFTLLMVVGCIYTVGDEDIGGVEDKKDQ